MEAVMLAFIAVGFVGSFVMALMLLRMPKEVRRARLPVFAAMGAMGLDVFVHTTGGHPLTVIGLDELDLAAHPVIIVLNFIAHSSFFVAFMWIAWSTWNKSKPVQST